MKLIKILPVVLLFCFINANAAVIDSVEETKISGNDKIKRLTVSGVIDNIDFTDPIQKNVTFEVLYPGVTKDNVEVLPRNESVYYMEQALTDDSGSYSFSCTMDENSRKYLIRIGHVNMIESGALEKTYSYVCPSDYIDLFNSINKAVADKSKENMKNTIDEYTRKNVISIDKYEELKTLTLDYNIDDIFSYMLNKESYTAISELTAMFEEGWVMVSASSGDTIDLILKDEERSLALGFDSGMLQLYNDLSEDKKNDINANVKPGSFEHASDLVQAFYDRVIFQSFSGILWQDIYEVLKKAENILNLDYTQFNNLIKIRQDYVFKLMAQNIGSITSMKSVIDVFNSDVEAAKYYVENTSSSPNGGNGGGSGGYSAPSYEKVTNSITADETALTQKNDSKILFEDMDDCAWAYDAVKYLFEQNIVNGRSKSESAPYDTITREEFVKMIVNAYDLDGELKKSVFVDVDDDAWYAYYVNTANENGIVNGISDYEFGIGENIKRKDMAVIVYRLMQKKSISFSQSEYIFNDVQNDYAYEAINSLYTKGIINGIDSEHFCPDNNLTRAQAAVVLYNALK